jgi:hypothetical protein
VSLEVLALLLSLFADTLPSSESSSSLSVYMVSCCLDHPRARNVLKSWKTTSVAIAATDMAATSALCGAQVLAGSRVVAQRRAAVEEGRTHVTIATALEMESVCATRPARCSGRDGELAARLPDFQYDRRSCDDESTRERATWWLRLVDLERKEKLERYLRRCNCSRFAGRSRLSSQLCSRRRLVQTSRCSRQARSESFPRVSFAAGHGGPERHTRSLQCNKSL